MRVFSWLRRRFEGRKKGKKQKKTGGVSQEGQQEVRTKRRAKPRARCFFIAMYLILHFHPFQTSIVYLIFQFEPSVVFRFVLFISVIYTNTLCVFSFTQPPM